MRNWVAMASVRPLMYNEPAVGDFDRFARYYDLDYEDYRADVDLYKAFAERSGSPILELGCGTGRLLLALAKVGCRLTGVDVSPAMLALATEKLAANALASRARLVQADARDFHLSERFALAICASNTLSLFTELADQLHVLRCAAAHLRPEGLLVVDVFHLQPAQFGDSPGHLVHDYTRRHPVSQHLVSKFHTMAIDTAEQRVDLTYFYDELDDDGAVRRTILPFAMHCYSPRELQLLLERAGYRLEHVYGSFDLEELDDESPIMIAVATKQKQE